LHSFPGVTCCFARAPPSSSLFSPLPFFPSFSLPFSPFFFFFSSFPFPFLFSLLFSSPLFFFSPPSLFLPSPLLSLLFL
ncbi:hypothetical protein ACXWR7_13055, partial [Streptococcus pyogenes]